MISTLKFLCKPFLESEAGWYSDNKNHRSQYSLEFKRSTDISEDFLGLKEDEANKQHKSIIEALKAAAPEWTFEQIKFVAGRRGAVDDDDCFYYCKK